MSGDPGALVTYLPLVQLVAFLAGWGLAMLTGLMFAKVAG